jgi:hypothetical protein
LDWPARRSRPTNKTSHVGTRGVGTVVRLLDSAEVGSARGAGHPTLHQRNL